MCARTTARGRVYIPKNDMEVFRVSEEQIAEGIVTPEFRGLMRCEVDYAARFSSRDFR